MLQRELDPEGGLQRRTTVSPNQKAMVALLRVVNPGLTWSLDFDTRRMVEEMHDLTTELHENPSPVFENMRVGDRYGEFELIFSELEEECAPVAYNPCVEFAHFNREGMAHARTCISRH